jgi:hypothetical protein
MHLAVILIVMVLLDGLAGGEGFGIFLGILGGVLEIVQVLERS